MATNDFLPFGGDGAANVIAQATYAALAQRTSGFQSGVAQSAQLNKVWRQSSIMSAVLAQFIADNSGANSVDDGTTATLLANLKIAASGRLIGVQVFTSSGTYNPTAGTRSVIAEGVGGGAGGGGASATAAGQVSAGSGGSSGTYGKGRFITGFTGIPVTIGAGGTGGPAGANNGSAGGTTSFGSLMSCPGGVGGGGSNANSVANITAASGGAALPTGATIVAAAGSTSGAGFSLIPAGVGGDGGPSVFGGVNNNSSNSAGTAGNAPGTGGGGGSRLAGQGVGAAGGDGAKGILIVYEFA